MWFIVVLMVIAVVAVMVKLYMDEAKAERLESEKAGRQKEVEAAAQVPKARFEEMTDSEKAMLSAEGEEVLETTLNAFRRAGEGDADAMLFMAITYQSKLQNEQKAFNWMKKASDAGSAEAMYWLGEFYVNGYGVPVNKMKGVSKIIDAAKNGSPTAIESLKENGMTEEQMRSVGIAV